MNPPALPTTAAFLLVLVSIAAAPAQVNVATYHNDNRRSGLNSDEAILTPANVNSATFGKLFSYAVTGAVYAQPLYVSGLNIPGRGTHNVLFIATQHNTVYAFDADNPDPPGGLLWQTNLGPSAVTPNSDFGNRYGSYSDIRPEVGITGTPVIDLSAGTLYADAFTHEGSSYHHRLHALDITTGEERANSPAEVSVSIAGVGVGGSSGVVPVTAKRQIQRAALTLANGIVYINFAGYADTDPYHGWVIGFDAATMELLTNHVFNTTPNSTTATFGLHAGEAGIWMAGGGMSVDDAGNLYFEVGNGSFNAYNGSGGTEYGDSFMKLSTAGGLAVADYFTPYNQQHLADYDIDVGSSGLRLLPDQAGPYPHLLIGGGKEGRIYLLNRDQFTTADNHYNDGGSQDDVVQSFTGAIGSCFNTPVYANDRVFFASSNDKMKAFSLTSGTLSTNPVSTGTRTFGFPGATGSVSANGTNNAILWALQRSTPAVLVAYNPADLSTELYASDQAALGRDQLATGIKFAVCTVANGKAFTGGSNSVAVLGLLSPFKNWQFAHFGTDTGVASAFSDNDVDAALNLLEYGLASDPNNAADRGALSGALAAGQLQIQFHRNTLATDLTYTLESAPDALGPWSPVMTYTSGGGWDAILAGATAQESVPSIVAPDQFVTVTITDPTPPPVSGGWFYRMSVHQ
jgi:hypothetical protein